MCVHRDIVQLPEAGPWMGVHGYWCVTHMLELIISHEYAGCLEVEEEGARRRGLTRCVPVCLWEI